MTPAPRISSTISFRRLSYIPNLIAACPNVGRMPLMPLPETKEDLLERLRAAQYQA